MKKLCSSCKKKQGTIAGGILGFLCFECFKGAFYLIRRNYVQESLLKRINQNLNTIWECSVENCRWQIYFIPGDNYQTLASVITLHELWHLVNLSSKEREEGIKQIITEWLQQVENLELLDAVAQNIKTDPAVKGCLNLFLYQTLNPNGIELISDIKDD